MSVSFLSTSRCHEKKKRAMLIIGFPYAPCGWGQGVRLAQSRWSQIPTEGRKDPSARREDKLAGPSSTLRSCPQLPAGLRMHALPGSAPERRYASFLRFSSVLRWDSQSIWRSAGHERWRALSCAFIFTLKNIVPFSFFWFLCSLVISVHAVATRVQICLPY